MRFVIDKFIGTEFQTTVSFFFRSNCNNHLCAKILCQLNRRDTNATASSMNQKPFAVLKFASLKYIVPNGKNGFRQAGCLLKSKIIRNRQTLSCIYFYEIGITAARYQCAYFVSCFPLMYILSCSFNNSCNLQT